MKAISQDDLELLVPLINDRPLWSIEDFKLLLDRFGSDYFIEDGIFVKTKDNEEIAKVRNEYCDEDEYERHRVRY